LDRWSVFAVVFTVGVLTAGSALYLQNLGFGGTSIAVWNPHPTPISAHFTNTSLGVALYLSISSEFNKPGETFAINVSEYNFENYSNQITTEQDWALPDLSLTPCSGNYPFGFSIFRGNYSIKDISSLKQKTSLALYMPGAAYGCPVIFAITAYVIDPQSTNSNITENGPGSVTFYLGQLIGVVDVNGIWSTSIFGTSFGSFSSGVYTVVAGDEWGDIVMSHFVIN
jgi:hypothetical protein